MEDFRYVLIVIGVLAIIGLLLHGMWSIRRQQPRKMKAKPLADVTVSGGGDSSNVDKDGFDADGIGSVRTIKVEREHHEPQLGASSVPADAQESKQEPSFAEPVISEPQVEITLRATEPSPEPTVAAQEPSESMESPQIEETQPVENIESSTMPTPEPVAESNASPEPVQPQVETDPLFAPREERSVLAEPAPENKVITEPVDVLVLHVVANEGEVLHGAELLHNFLTLGMKFGEMNIFHRHQDSAGRGPVMYSLANMVQPGVFEPNTMEQFETEGVSLFMTLPNQCDETVGFSMMLGAAQALADMHGAKLLDDGHQLWSEQSKDRYMGRIQAFESSPTA